MYLLHTLTGTVACAGKYNEEAQRRVKCFFRMNLADYPASARRPWLSRKPTDGKYILVYM